VLTGKGVAGFITCAVLLFDVRLGGLESTSITSTDMPQWFVGNNAIKLRKKEALLL
jgi:hypothetical protein